MKKEKKRIMEGKFKISVLMKGERNKKGREKWKKEIKNWGEGWEKGEEKKEENRHIR